MLLLFDHLVEQGMDGDRLLRMANIDRARFEASGAMMLQEDVENFVVSARRLTGRSDLGFELGRIIKLNSHDVLSAGMLSCKNFDAMLRLAARHYHLMTETVTLRYRRVPTYGEATYTPITRMPLELLHFYLEVLAMSHCNQVELMLGSGRVPTYDVHMSMPEPAHVRRYLSIPSVRFHFDSGTLPAVRVVMSAELLDRPQPMYDPRQVQRVDEQCGTMPRPSIEGGWGDYITMMLREAQGEMITLDDLANRISVSARTIDRHLKKENLQFRDLSQRVRFERACTLLRVQGATVAQVALALGFSDAANFSRAFRRQFGMSPSQFQQQPASLDLA